MRFLAGDDRVPLEPLPPGAAHFEPLLKRALARDPEERYGTAAEMLEALRAVSEPSAVN